MTPINTTEKSFETAIEQHLLTVGGYLKGDAKGYDRARGLFPAETLKFIAESQPTEWSKLGDIFGADRDSQVIATVSDWLDKNGTLESIRRPVKIANQFIRLAFFPPANQMNEVLLGQVAKNRVTITRQVFFNPNSNQSVDVVGAVNGVPVFTAELKNHFTGQDVSHAIAQYKTDRDPKTKLFAPQKRTVVHFAVDPDLVFMTTEILGADTTFLPFNKGNGMGKGNPPNPDGFKTAYLWEEVLVKDSLLDILAKFVQVEQPKQQFPKKKPGESVAAAGPPRLLFPRYHQLRAVRRVEASCRTKGAGTNYLIQHSAGSGKTNTISWLAYRLQSLHDAQDKKIFDSVIVITDRTVLDTQLQDTIYQFDHKKGVVEKIDDDSAQLADALRARVPIVITTIQKFPFAQGHLGGDPLPEGRYAIIIDEAHSSQSGETSIQMKRVLGGKKIAEAAKAEAEAQGVEGTYEEDVIRRALSRGKQENMSFFAFTATPKGKTLELFGVTGPNGKPTAFDLYPMRQAIEEDFILDVLQNYTTYGLYYELIDKSAQDLEVDKRAAVKALARYVSLHPHNIAQKVEIIVEHFRASTMHKIGGKAKAMVVTSSREHAVRYKQAFDRYLKDHGYTEIRSLVAFSGHIVLDELPDMKFTEVGMNKGIGEKELPEKFATEEYQVLLVADKYQTGFDEPLLHTMYVDKRLDGVQAVQTLSRLNRKAPGKTDTFVLDFYNRLDDIQEAFQPYYEGTSIAATTDPKLLNELQKKLSLYGLYDEATVAAVAALYFSKPGGLAKGSKDLGKLYSLVDPVAERWESLKPVEKKDEFKKELTGFLNLYSFLAQVMPYHDPSLEALFLFGKFLADKLRDPGSPHLDLSDQVALHYYNLKKTSEGGIGLVQGGDTTVSAPSAVGSGGPKGATGKLSEIITRLNDLFGTDFTEADEVVFDGMKAEAIEDADLQLAARANSIENFQIAYKKKEQEIAISRMDKNQDLMERFFNDDQFRAAISSMLMPRVYEAIRARAAEGTLPTGRPQGGGVQAG
jgi:type I restriction enzyme R subunit